MFETYCRMNSQQLSRVWMLTVGNGSSILKAMTFNLRCLWVSMNDRMFKSKWLVHCFCVESLAIKAAVRTLALIHPDPKGTKKCALAIIVQIDLDLYILEQTLSLSLLLYFLDSVQHLINIHLSIYCIYHHDHVPLVSPWSNLLGAWSFHPGGPTEARPMAETPKAQQPVASPGADSEEEAYSGHA